MRRTLALAVALLLALAACGGDGDDGSEADGTTTTTTEAPTTEGPTSTDGDAPGTTEPDDPPPGEEATGAACLQGEMELVSVESQGDIPGLSGSDVITGTSDTLHLAIPEEGTWVMGGRAGAKLDVEIGPGVTGVVSIDGAVIGSYAESTAGGVRFTVDTADGFATATVEGTPFGRVPLDELSDLFSPEGRAEVACDDDEVTVETEVVSLVLRPTDDTVILDSLEG